MKRFVCIHGHFYQPPRENPWLKIVDPEDSAYPYHNWNERITAECYAPNTASRILGPDKHIIDIVNNYSKISFNFGPTLLSWIEKYSPQVYQEVLAADQLSQGRFSGHGSALAQPYNHLIMPLANRRDKRTQVAWGIKDFEFRFKRKPEGIWLPETAVDLETLEVLADFGMKFTILSPSQAKRIRRLGEKKWLEVTAGNIDPKMPYLCVLPSGRSICLFFYDGPIAQDIAFGKMLENGESFARRLTAAFETGRADSQLVQVACDGETYGHHHHFGEMALAYCLYYIEANQLAKITIYAEYLEKNPPGFEVEVSEFSSWSCPHGVERWRQDCGCCLGSHPRWHQKWRAPLREAMDWLRDKLIAVYERESAEYLSDPWKARDEYIEVILDRTPEKIENFTARQAARQLTRDETIKVTKLLEMQLQAMLMYTSCGWFFDDVTGIESIQILKYAARAIQLAEEISGEKLETEYLNILAKAVSNLPEFGNAARVYESMVKPAVVNLLRVGAHYAISSLFDNYPRQVEIYCYTAINEGYEFAESGRQKLALGKTRIRSNITLEEEFLSFAVLQFSNNNIVAGVRSFGGEETYRQMAKEINEAFQNNNIAEIIHLMDKNFGVHNYSLWHLFKDEQRKILSQILENTLGEIESSYRQIYKVNYPMMQLMSSIRMPLPKVLSTAVEYVINLDLRQELKQEKLDFERLSKLVSEVKRWSCELDKPILNYVVAQKINRDFDKLRQQAQDSVFLENIESLFRILTPLSLRLDLWQAQNIYFSIGREFYTPELKNKAAEGDPAAKRWIVSFEKLGNYLSVSLG